MAPRKEGRKTLRYANNIIPRIVRTTIKKNCLTFSGSKVFMVPVYSKILRLDV
jgi:hypothetical protein